MVSVINIIDDNLDTRLADYEENITCDNIYQQDLE